MWWRWRVVTHPSTAVAVAVLIVNDSLLKARYPGVVTGKLSDLCGVWMIAMLLTAATGDERLGTAATAIGFAALKTLPAVGRLAAPVLGGRTLADASDLVALVVLPAVWSVARRLRAEPTPAAISAWLRGGAALVVVASTFATTATSCDVRSEVVGLASASDGRVLVQHSGDGHPWYSVDGTGVPVLVDSAVGTSAAAAGTEACAGGRCFRVEPDVGLFEGTRPLVQLTDRDKGVLRDATECLQRPPFAAVVAREVGGGVEVWATLGMAGVLHVTQSGVVEQVYLPGLKAIRLTFDRPSVERSVPGPPGTPRRRVIGGLVLVASGIAVIAVFALVLALTSGHRRSRH